MTNSGGGAATAGGMDFQHRVAAWATTRILAEADAPVLWDLPAATTFEWIRCETENPVDDLLLGTSTGGVVFVNVKRTVEMSGAPGSALSSAIAQIVRQALVGRAAARSEATPEKLDYERDRLVLAVSSSSSEPVRSHLPAILHRVRSLVPGQVLEDAAVNAEERRILSVLQELVRTSWHDSVGADPSVEEIGTLLRFLRVQVFDLDGGEAEAKATLRTAVVTRPEQADLAWTHLVAFCAGLAVRRAGAPRSEIQRLLTSSEILIRAPRTFRNDIERLRDYSRSTLEALSHLSYIRVGKARIRVSRPSLEALKTAVDGGTLVVVGEPGAGKSGELHALVESILADHRDCVFVAVDRLASGSVSELRHELGLEHEFLDVLSNWTGRGPAFLVIDALDAARGDAAASTIRELMRWTTEHEGRWRTVASVRKFDLRYGVEIRSLFAGAPPTAFRDAEFNDVRHVNVPQLSDPELAQIAKQAPELYALVQRAPPELHALLLIPFNLRLMAELLGLGVPASELSPIRTQLELLDRYWKSRVVRSDGGGDAREAVLLAVCERMVETRALRADRTVLANQPGALHELLRTQVLIEWQPAPESQPLRYILAFAHHVLFDYAAARLLFTGVNAAVVARLEANPDLPIIVRPSLIFHFRRVWSADPARTEFWDLVFRVIGSEGISEIGKLIGPSVAGELAKAIGDLEPLCAALSSPTPSRGIAESALRHLVGAALTIAAPNGMFVGPGAGPWSNLVERVSRDLRVETAYSVRSLLVELCERVDVLTREQLIAAGRSARSLLKFAWEAERRDPWLVIHALQCVCRTFGSDVETSGLLIRRALEGAHVKAFGYEELPWIAREVAQLSRLAPDLVEDIYLAAFRNQEASDEPTPLGSSQIMPMRSTRKQDYGMALYELGSSFEQFLSESPVNATRALVRVVEAYVRDDHHVGAREEVPVKNFDFDGRNVRFVPDYSGIWDEGDTYVHDAPVRMLDAFEKYLKDIAGEERESQLETFHQILRVLTEQESPAVLWRRILAVGAASPNTTLGLLAPLASAVPILASGDTTTPAGEFIRHVFPLFNRKERERVERAILAIPAQFPSQQEVGEHARNRVLGCLSSDDLVTSDARSILGRLLEEDAVPSNEPLVRFSGFTGRPYTEELYLRDQGVPVDDVANQRVRDLETPLIGFAERLLNATPSRDDVAGIIQPLQALAEALKNSDRDGVHPKQQEHALGTLASACSRIARFEDLSCSDATGSFVRSALLKVSEADSPEYDDEADAQFNEHPSWGSPAPRIDAAIGLMDLAAGKGCATTDVLNAIERLSKDQVPAVRFQVARRLSALYQTAPDVMWRIATEMSRDERNRGVVAGVLAGGLHPLAGIETDRVTALTKMIFSRVVDGPGAREVRKLSVGIFAGLYVWRNQADCAGIVKQIVADVDGRVDDAHDVLFSLREALVHGPTDRDDAVADAVRGRAFGLLLEILRSESEALQRYNQRLAATPLSQWPSKDQEAMRGVLHLVDGVATEVFFDSGAYLEKRGQKLEGVSSVSPQSARFFREASAVLDLLSKLRVPSVTHHVVQTLEHFIPLDPPTVFLRLAHVMEAARAGGYQYESLAADLIVRVVERYLAEYRSVLRDNPECRRALVEILDLFVQAGWPSARRLTYRLEDIFR